MSSRAINLGNNCMSHILEGNLSLYEVKFLGSSSSLSIQGLDRCWTTV